LIIIRICTSRGRIKPMAFVDISVFGKSTDAQCADMTVEVCKILGTFSASLQIAFTLNTAAQISGAGII
jgi:hypothetical protein